MKTKTIIKILISLVLVLFSVIANCDNTVRSIASANGFAASGRVVKAISRASKYYNIDEAELTAIAIVETGLGKYAATRVNQNGTVDQGLFQINSVNQPYCSEYDLSSPEGSAMCAAKLLARIRLNHDDYIGRYHSKTPTLKIKYTNKIIKVLNTQPKEDYELLYGQN